MAQFQWAVPARGRLSVSLLTSTDMASITMVCTSRSDQQRALVVSLGQHGRFPSPGDVHCRSIRHQSHPLQVERSFPPAPGASVESGVLSIDMGEGRVKNISVGTTSVTVRPVRPAPDVTCSWPSDRSQRPVRAQLMIPLRESFTLVNSSSFDIDVSGSQTPVRFPHHVLHKEAALVEVFCPRTEPARVPSTGCPRHPGRCCLGASAEAEVRCASSEPRGRQSQKPLHARLVRCTNPHQPRYLAAPRSRPIVRGAFGAHASSDSSTSCCQWCQLHQRDGGQRQAYRWGTGVAASEKCTCVLPCHLGTARGVRPPASAVNSPLVSTGVQFSCVPFRPSSQELDDLKASNRDMVTRAWDSAAQVRRCSVPAA